MTIFDSYQNFATKKVGFTIFLVLINLGLKKIGSEEFGQNWVNNSFDIAVKGKCHKDR